MGRSSKIKITNINLSEPVLLGHVAMLVFSMLVAGSFSLGSIIANQVAPDALTAIRFLIAFIIIVSITLVREGVPRSSLVSPWRYFVLGGLFVSYFVLMFEGLKTATPVSAAAVFTLTPLLSAIIGYFMLKQIINKRIALALFIGIIGALWAIFRADLNAFLSFDVGSGELIYLVGCVAHAAYTPAVRKLNRGESPLVFTSGILCAGFIILAVVSWENILLTQWLMLPLSFWFSLLYLAIFASSVTILLLHYSTMRLPASKVMAYTYLTPSWVVLWEMALGKQSPPLLVLLGVILIFFSLLLLLRD